MYSSQYRQNYQTDSTEPMNTGVIVHCGTETEVRVWLDRLPDC
jgi:hypothetical protein